MRRLSSLCCPHKNAGCGYGRRAGEKVPMAGGVPKGHDRNRPTGQNSIDGVGSLVLAAELLWSLPNRDPRRQPCPPHPSFFPFAAARRW
jgi:hypothetical protein